MNDLFNDLLSDCVLMFRPTVDKKRVRMYILIPKGDQDMVKDIILKEMIKNAETFKKDINDSGRFIGFPKDIRFIKRFYRVDYKEPRQGRFHIGSNVKKIYPGKYFIFPVRALCFLFNCSFDSEDNLILSDKDLNMAGGYVQIFTSIKAY